MSPKTVNNVLVTLSTMLKVAKEWGVIAHVPCAIRLLKTTVPTVAFYEQTEYQALVDAARAVDPRTELLVLLSGDAGLRRGEIIGLEQQDCDTKRGILPGPSRCRWSFPRRRRWRWELAGRRTDVSP